MSTTKLYWQREAPLADFSDGNKGNLIFVSTSNGVKNALDDIYDDIRNDDLNIITISSGNDGFIDLSILETSTDKSGDENVEKHRFLVSALSSAQRTASHNPGSVIIVNTSSLAIDKMSSGGVSALMKAKDIHVVLVATVEGIVAMQDFLALDTHISIDVENTVHSLSY